jgi:hypothetical protein
MHQFKKVFYFEVSKHCSETLHNSKDTCLRNLVRRHEDVYKVRIGEDVVYKERVGEDVVYKERVDEDPKLRF